MTNENIRLENENDWATIRAILLIGGSLPARLQKKYDAHMQDIADRMVIGLKRLPYSQ